MRSRVSNLPEVKPSELASLRTLGQIVEYMRGKNGPSADASVGSSAATRLQAQKEGHDPPKVDPELKADALRIVEPVGRYRVELMSSPAPGLAIAGLYSAVRVRICGENPVATALAKRLSELRADVLAVAVPEGDDDFVIALDGLNDVRSIDDAIAINRTTFAKVKPIAAQMAARGGTLVLVQDTGGDFGLAGREPLRAWLGGVSALGRTCAQEWPKATVQTLDIARGGRSPEAIADAIVSELLNGAGAREVALLSDGSRATVRCVREPLSVSTPVLKPGAVVVATGGARGVTARCLLSLAQSVSGVRIALIGRTPLEAEPEWARSAGTQEPALKRACMVAAQARGEKIAPAQVGAMVARVVANREVAGNIAALQQAGAEVLYLATDVQNATQLSEALSAVRAQWGGISALVHGAGVLADKLIEAKTQEQFDRVFDTKVTALKTLLEVTAQDELAAICLFSSVAARTGNTGQSDYAMANEVLNLVALSEQTRRADRCVVRSLGWGPWAGGMVTAELEKHFASMGVALIGLDSGAQAFVNELSHRTASTQVVISGADDGKGLGEGSLGSSHEQPVLSELRVSAASDPALADHAIAGTVVAPVVMALEWMIRAAKTLAPALSVRAVRGVQVMSGIKLDRYAKGGPDGDVFTLSAKKLSNGAGLVAAVELRGAKHRLHYRAQVELGEPLEGLSGSVSALLAKLGGTKAMDARTAYDGHVLFHGERFQVIDRVEGLSREGAVATMHGLLSRGWRVDGWQTDPALMDGVLQLAVLWSKSVLGGATLPMSIGSVAFGYRGPLDPSLGVLRVVVQGQVVESNRAVCDVTVVDSSSRVLFAFSAVEVILRPGEPQVQTAVSNT
jgi:NADP-dependent 3-hydroxy acid dehydrogenase YdfG